MGIKKIDKKVSKVKLIAPIIIFFLNSLSAQEKSYTIIWGDTLAKIAYRNYGDGSLFPKIAEANNIENPHLIIAGHTILLPKITPAPPEPPPPVETLATWRKIDNRAFSVGERLKYDIRWQFITAGVATMNIDEIVQINGRSAYKVVSETRSTPFIDTFFRVRNTNISFIDTESICSHRFKSNIHEGGFRRNRSIEFDQINNTFRSSDEKSGDTKPFVQDVLSALYFTRLQGFDIGSEFYFDAHSGDKTYPLVVKVHKREKVRVPAGEFECYKIEPRVQGMGVFRAKGRLLVWVTTDERRLPVLMRSEVFIGSVDAVLTEYTTTP